MSNSIPSTSLLIADDEIEIGEIIQAVAEDLGYKVTCVNEGLQVVSLVERLKPDVIALDLRMPGADGVEIIRELGQRKCTASIILMSGMDQRTLSSVQALGKEHELNIAGTLTKPMSVDAIEGALRPHLTSGNSKPVEPDRSRSAMFNYGLGLKYQPEFSLRPLGEKKTNRIRVVPSWRLDSGETLIGNSLNEWLAQTGIGKGVSKMMSSSALETLRVWGNQGFGPELSLPLDPSLYCELDIPDILAEIVDHFFVPRELVTLEVDEASVTQKQNSVVDVLSRLRIKGFKLSICIDGEGEAILPIIDSLPIDQVVINMEYMSRKKDFLQNMETEFSYSSLISMANHKGISACASYVDTPDILTFIKRCKFNSARGSQIHPPIRADEILPLYTDSKFVD